MTVLSFYYVTQSFHEKNHRLENLDFRREIVFILQRKL